MKKKEPDILPEKKESSVMVPKLCQSETPAEVLEMIAKVNWAEFGTAYGNAEYSVPIYLKNIFCTDESVALLAAHQLWCSICHQGVNMADAALPSYEILKTGLVTLSGNLKIEILDIFTGFALCMSKEYITYPNELSAWEKQVQHKLMRDRSLFNSLIDNHNEAISASAKLICEYLDNQKT
ncbi:hypothetical protein [Hymenobacter daeguensis]